MILETILPTQESREKGAAAKEQASDAAPTSEAAVDIRYNMHHIWPVTC